MKYYTNRGCLAYHNSHPVFQNIDFSSMKIGTFLSHADIKSLELKHDYDCDGEATPDTYPELHAMKFYAFNHALATLQMRNDPEEVLDDATDELVAKLVSEIDQMAMRAFYYLLLIIIRESRHLKTGEASEKYKIWQDKYGPKLAKFHREVHDDPCINTIIERLSLISEHTIGQLVSCTHDKFFGGKWESGYGGKAWAEVANCLKGYVHGEYSASIMTDTVWTLCHNNGPIFNKGMLYHTYCANSIYMILDVQRGGMIPQLIRDIKETPHKFPNRIREVVKSFSKDFDLSIIGGDFSENTSVDWKGLAALGAHQNYDHMAETTTSSNKSSFGKPVSLGPFMTVKIIDRSQING